MKIAKVKNIKRICALLLIVILVAFALASCSSGNNTNDSSSNESTEKASGEAENAEAAEPFKIVTTIFPEYDWTREILGDNPANAELIMLLDKGVDLHNFQPTAQDIMNISTCDLFVYIGGESDGWVSDALKEAVNPDMVVINILESLGDLAKEEEHVEGMEDDHEHEEGEEHADEDNHEEGEEHADEENHEEGEEHEGELDEHVWLSLRNAIELTNIIADAIKQIDPTNAETYTVNTEAYVQKLTALDSEYQTAIATKERDTILFGDRFPFRYLVDDYDINYYAAFSGCSAETEASFETVTFLANKVDELKLPYVMTIEGTDHRIAQTIISNTTDKNQEVLTIDSMQSTTSEAIANGTTYLSLMEKNLEVLKQALGTK